MKEIKGLKNIPENVIIPNVERLEALLKVFKEEGKEKIHVLADFDRTLTKAFVNGQKVPSVISILRDGRFLTPEYVQQANELFNQYHPIEIDPDVSLEEKIQKMEEWWRRHFELLLKSGLSKKEINEVAQDLRIQLRPGVKEFLQKLHQQQIPLVVLSSAGLGVESIVMILQREKCFYDNIHIISNEFKYDDQGRAVKVKEPIIHTLNKDETMVSDFPEIYKQIENRQNVILLGDSVSDIGMVAGFTHKSIIKVGFLNENIDQNMEAYKKNFNLVITEDKDMKFVNQLVNKII